MKTLHVAGRTAAIIDAAALIALIDKDDRDRRRCLEALDGLGGPPISTWVAFAAAMDALGRIGGRTAESALWRLVLQGRLLVDMPSAFGADAHAACLMERYAHRAMSLADATLVALAEERGTRRVVTPLASFTAYRYKELRRFEVVRA